ncbi:hypothetical protein [Streptomyces flavofungini]|uniref:DUF4352 domain-containing protein n=1 Tax=Streptomyces flavofungini TaxID=68200 RepID=A0ABS0XA90_9ACTN|nr:hypothetical protein [Streptomyces flavofungini]MBJ3809884.1 hypothetical protein [Streptomyces flavofungini]
MMDIPNVVGDWQEYQSEEWAGLRVRVHHLRRATPQRGRDEDAKGLTYVAFDVTLDNRGSTYFSIDLHDHPRHYDVRVGRDGHGAFVDEFGGAVIRDFNLYPQRRVTATLYAAAPASKLKQLDIQISPAVDDEPAFGYVWSGGLGVHEGSTRTDGRASSAKTGVASEVERFLQDSSGD